MGPSPAQGPQSRGAAVSPMTGKPIPPPPGFPRPALADDRQTDPTSRRARPRAVPEATRTRNQDRANARPGPVAGRTPARVARPTYRVAPQAGRGRGPGKVARLLLAVARWPRAAVLAARCHAPAPRVVPVARGQVLALVAPDSGLAPLGARVALGCGQVAGARPLGGPRTGPLSRGPDATYRAAPPGSSPYRGAPGAGAATARRWPPRWWSRRRPWWTRRRAQPEPAQAFAR